MVEGCCVQLNPREKRMVGRIKTEPEAVQSPIAGFDQAENAGKINNRRTLGHHIAIERAVDLDGGAARLVEAQTGGWDQQEAVFIDAMSVDAGAVSDPAIRAHPLVCANRKGAEISNVKILRLQLGADAEQGEQPEWNKGPGVKFRRMQHGR